MESTHTPWATSPMELVINLTLRCPLKCSHCCFSSDMSQHGHLPFPEIERAIAQAALLGTFRIVHFVGGDPFIYPDALAAGVAQAAAQGLDAGVTTSAYWAKNETRALETLERMRSAGLTEITISYDDPHAKFVPLRFIQYALKAALALRLKTRIAVVVEPGAQITAAWMRDALNVDPETVLVYETPVNSTGRAAEVEDDERLRRQAQDTVYRGPCHSMLRAITVDHEGDIRPCCGVLPHREGLSLGNLSETDVAAAVRTAYDDLLYKWIAFEGPVAVLLDVTAQDAKPFKPEDFDGICTACDAIFSDPALLSRARQRAQERAARVDAFERLYAHAGLFVPPPVPA